ncbi:MAG: hypothetical protein GKS04_01195 [Candidatus Mycalebacterium zealandia]|nr:MAG: hypothetical protein GKS04_01195 [Candidatus Mycalebacterium zealandia]
MKSAYLFAALVFAPSSQADFEADCAGFNPKPLAKKTVVLANGKKRLKINAEIARTDSEKTRGLMCRKNLRNGSGMLFVFDRPQKAGFWMFNTHFDLDILYIEKGGRVIGGAEMKKCPRREGEKTRGWQKRCSSLARAYKPPAPYSAALELPAGWLKRKGLERGAITISFPERE